MLEYKRGDILTEDADALVNTVNCVGVMGRGIALQFKKAFPDNFKVYAEACERGEVQPGRMLVFETQQLTKPRYIINFPTKRDWRNKSRLEDIESGLKSLVAEIQNLEIQSVAIPPLGSGLGGLDWDDVRPRIEEALRSIQGLQITVYEPGGAPDATQMARTQSKPKMTPGRAALVGLLDRYHAVLLDPFVTLLEAHKLMYFLQEAGESLRLRYAAGPYGPYAENLRHVFNAIEGHLLSGYVDGGDSPHKELGFVPGAVDRANNYLDEHDETRSRFDRVAALVEGFETPFGLELLSTVHWVVTQNGATTFNDVVTQTYEWSERKRRFSLDQIRLALERLASQDFLPTPVLEN